MPRPLKALSILLLTLFAQVSTAQTTVVKGKVTDAETGESLPFVNVIFYGIKTGTTTDFDGYYQIETQLPVDSIVFSYVGYGKVIRAVEKGKNQTLNVQMKSSSAELREFVIKPGTNPANIIIKRVQQNKKLYNIEKLEAYEYESYNRVQLAVDNITEALKERKVYKEIAPLFDTMSAFDESGQAKVLPVFVSESLSNYYFRKDPRRTKEEIIATKVSGVGVGDDSYISQVLGATFQQYNFNENNLYILDKDFISPISVQSLSYYVFILQDSVYLDGKKCFEIRVEPKNEKDLVFRGTIWIADSSYALKRLALEITDAANINFVEKLKIQQELVEVDEGAWLPAKTRVLLDVADFTGDMLGIVGLYYNSNRNHKVNQQKPLSFFEEKISIDPDIYNRDQGFWDRSRHEKISAEDIRIYGMVDSLKNKPIIKSYVDLVEVLVDGYRPIGKIDIGPYWYLAGWNPLEGFRTRIGLRTNEDFSKKWVFKAFGAYGFGDEQFKYGLDAKHILSRKKWTTIGLSARRDVELIGLTDRDYGTSAMFDAFSTFGSNRLNRAEEYLFTAERELLKGYTQKVSFGSKHFIFEPQEGFNFQYRSMPELGESSPLQSNFRTTTLQLEGRWSYKELYVIRKNKRVSLGNYKAPVVTLSYTHGFRDLLMSDFHFQKWGLHVWQFNSLANLGTFEYNFRAGKTFGTLPFPALEVIRGNQSPFSIKDGFNMMNFYEFIADAYIMGHYEHQFNGLIMNRIPLLQRWKWRSFVNAKAIYGALSSANENLIPADIRNNLGVNTFDQRAYAEVGYGIENILKVLRVDFIHRLSYLEHSGVRPFAVKGNVVIRF